MNAEKDFLVPYCIGHKGDDGYECLDFEIIFTGCFKYLNNSEYKSDCLISKEVIIIIAIAYASEAMG